MASPDEAALKEQLRSKLGRGFDIFKPMSTGEGEGYLSNLFHIQDAESGRMLINEGIGKQITTAQSLSYGGLPYSRAPTVEQADFSHIPRPKIFNGDLFLKNPRENRGPFVMAKLDDASTPVQKILPTESPNDAPEIPIEKLPSSAADFAELLGPMDVELPFGGGLLRVSDILATDDADAVDRIDRVIDTLVERMYTERSLSAVEQYTIDRKLTESLIGVPRPSGDPDAEKKWDDKVTELLKETPLSLQRAKNFELARTREAEIKRDYKVQIHNQVRDIRSGYANLVPEVRKFGDLASAQEAIKVGIAPTIEKVSSDIIASTTRKIYNAKRRQPTQLNLNCNQEPIDPGKDLDNDPSIFGVLATSTVDLPIDGKITKVYVADASEQKLVEDKVRGSLPVDQFIGTVEDTQRSISKPISSTSPKRSIEVQDEERNVYVMDPDPLELPKLTFADTSDKTPRFFGEDVILNSSPLLRNTITQLADQQSIVGRHFDDQVQDVVRESSEETVKIASDMITGVNEIDMEVVTIFETPEEEQEFLRRIAYFGEKIPQINDAMKKFVSNRNNTNLRILFNDLENFLLSNITPEMATPIKIAAIQEYMSEDKLQNAILQMRGLDEMKNKLLAKRKEMESTLDVNIAYLERSAVPKEEREAFYGEYTGTLANLDQLDRAVFQSRLTLNQYLDQEKLHILHGTDSLSADRFIMRAISTALQESTFQREEPVMYTLLEKAEYEKNRVEALISARDLHLQEQDRVWQLKLAQMKEEEQKMRAAEESQAADQLRQSYLARDKSFTEIEEQIKAAYKLGAKEIKEQILSSIAPVKEELERAKQELQALRTFKAHMEENLSSVSKDKAPALNKEIAESEEMILTAKAAEKILTKTSITDNCKRSIANQEPVQELNRDSLITDLYIRKKKSAKKIVDLVKDKQYEILERSALTDVVETEAQHIQPLESLTRDKEGPEVRYLEKVPKAPKKKRLLPDETAHLYKECKTSIEELQSSQKRVRREEIAAVLTNGDSINVEIYRNTQIPQKRLSTKKEITTNAIEGSLISGSVASNLAAKHVLGKEKLSKPSTSCIFKGATDSSENLRNVSQTTTKLADKIRETQVKEYGDVFIMSKVFADLDGINKQQKGFGIIHHSIPPGPTKDDIIETNNEPLKYCAKTDPKPPLVLLAPSRKRKMKDEAEEAQPEIEETKTEEVKPKKAKTDGVVSKAEEPPEKTPSAKETTDFKKALANQPFHLFHKKGLNWAKAKSLQSKIHKFVSRQKPLVEMKTENTTSAKVDIAINALIAPINKLAEEVKQPIEVASARESLPTTEEKLPEPGIQVSKKRGRAEETKNVSYDEIRLADCVKNASFIVGEVSRIIHRVKKQRLAPKLENDFGKNLQITAPPVLV